MKKLVPELFVLCAILMVVSYGFAQTWTIKNVNMFVLLPGGVTMSADGKVIIAVGSGSVISTNYGASWTNGLNYYECILASSADETRVIEATHYPMPVLISTNFGVSWNPTPTPNTNWSAVASSADGTKLYAAVNGGPIYCSTNSGNSWQINGWPSKSWTALAVSADGTKLFATSSDSIYASTNSGFTCALLSSPTNGWNSICCSADGTFLAAAGKSCFISTNSGANWQPTGQSFNLIACSADGSKLIASTGGIYYYSTTGYIYISTDYGNTWVSNSPPQNAWACVNCSADGNEFVATENNSPSGVTKFWILKNTPTPQLNLTTSDTNLALSWLIPSTNFVVQQSPDLISWSSLTDAPAFNFTNLNYSLPLSPTNSTSFFRLISQ